MVPEPTLVARFERNLDALSAPGQRLGIAVSGGPDSLALLILAAAARPGAIEAASVDHALRPESPSEAKMVAGVCRQLGVPHAILTVSWVEKPVAAIQERARSARYGLLADWVSDRALDALVTAHQANDQAETLVMRLNRGSGVRGLAAMRPSAYVPRSAIPLLRPLLGWRRAELGAICAAAGLTPTADPGNEDARYERIRIRNALGEAEWLDAEAVGRSAAYLASADDTIGWAAAQEWDRTVTAEDRRIAYRPSGAPAEIVRRIVARAVTALAHEGLGEALRGRELASIIEALEAGRTATLRGVLCAGGKEWRFSKAPARKA
ncbi:MAG TPA: tRNA lysidine(34) synthetase TilS [Sphingomicrobium sp.]|nr:tRNA lysidine(34) synthetase TilS [Sphingomicrobium sp.]